MVGDRRRMLELGRSSALFFTGADDEALVCPFVDMFADLCTTNPPVVWRAFEIDVVDCCTPSKRPVF